MLNIKAIDKSRVASVYSGRPGCMCGCRGNYRYASAHRAASSKDRGYNIDDDEVNDAQITRVLNILRKSLATQYDPKASCFFLELGCDRMYAAYLMR